MTTFTEINGRLIRAPFDTLPGWERLSLPGQPDNQYTALTIQESAPGEWVVEVSFHRRYLVVEAFAPVAFVMSVQGRLSSVFEPLTALSATLVGADYQARYVTEGSPVKSVRVWIVTESATEVNVEVSVGTTRMEVP